MQTNTNKHYNLKPPILLLHLNVFEEVVKTIGSLRAETGGVAGGDGDGEGASHYHFDKRSHNSAAIYSPDHRGLNRLFKNEWNPKGIRLEAIFHSHPGRMNRPSVGDEVYAERILKAIDDLECLWLPIINTFPDTSMFRLTPWAIYLTQKGVSVVRGQVQITRVPEKSFLNICGNVDVMGSIKLGMPLDEIIIHKEEGDRYVLGASVANRPSSTNSKILAYDWSEKQNDDACLKEPTWAPEAKKSFDVRNTLNRVQNAYDLALMGKARIFAVGTGGAADWLEQMARAGVGQFVIVDPDVVSETNLATQQTYRAPRAWIRDPMAQAFSLTAAMIFHLALSMAAMIFHLALSMAATRSHLVPSMVKPSTIEAAPAGHLVLGTLHSTSAPHAADCIIEASPTSEQSQIRSILADGLKAIVAQELFKRTDKMGRRAAREILIATRAIRNLIHASETHYANSYADRKEMRHAAFGRNHDGIAPKRRVDSDGACALNGAILSKISRRSQPCVGIYL